MDDGNTTEPSPKPLGLHPLSEDRPASGGRLPDAVVRHRRVDSWRARYKPGRVLPRKDDLTESLGVRRDNAVATQELRLTAASPAPRSSS
jgi:hypothetical protein